MNQAEKATLKAAVQVIGGYLRRGALKAGEVILGCTAVLMVLSILVWAFPDEITVRLLHFAPVKWVCRLELALFVIGGVLMSASGLTREQLKQAPKEAAQEGS